MTQTAPKLNARRAPSGRRTASTQAAASLAGAATALVLPLLSPQDASAQGWQITTQGTQGSRTTTIRRLHAGNGGVTAMKDGPAPPNNCRISAFEIVNPQRGEARCVGAVSSDWWR